MRRWGCLTLAATLVLASPAPADPAPAGTARDRAAILAVVARMERAWNRGDFRGYMAGFRNPGVVFVSGGRFQDGWQGTLDHYVRDYGASPRTRGTLRFYDMTVEMLADDAAMLVGRYHLERPVRAAEGVNTRLFRKIDGRWVITLNHVSAHDVPSRPAAPVSAPPASAPAVRPGPPSN
ncbi:YybH family protein [Sphingomonas corticis]|uniref:YybH family protein n=1 Tax=Sphingomonas corticis TaxID=2722791 RepID=UPI003B838C41